MPVRNTESALISDLVKEVWDLAQEVRITKETLNEMRQTRLPLCGMDQETRI